MLTDPALNTVAKRLLDIEVAVQRLRNDVAATDAQRNASQAAAAKSAPAWQPPPTSNPPATSFPPTTSDLSATSSPQAPQSQATTKPARGPAPPPRAKTSSANPLEAMLSGRGLAVTGLLLMLIGCAYFLDLSFTRGWVGPGQRIALGLIAGCTLIAASARFMRGAYRMVAEGTTGLGAGILYLSTWAAIAVFPDLHIPRIAAFATMIATTLALGFVANKARSQPVALMGLAGAYLTPLLLASGAPDRIALATYLLTVTGGMLVLARRRSFYALEIVTVGATLFYSGSFRPNSFAGWSNDAAATVASLFFVLFGIAFSARPPGTGKPAWRLVPFIFTATVYIAYLEFLLHSEQTLLGGALFTLTAALLGATRLKNLPREMRAAYVSLGVLTLNLALRELLHKTQLFDALAVEAAMLVLFGARSHNVLVSRVGIAFFAISAGGLLWQAATFAPLQSVLTPLALGFLTWIAAVVSARRAIPRDISVACSIAAHGVALAGLTRIGLDATGGALWNLALPSFAQVTVSMIWALFAAGLFGFGVSTRKSVLRWEGLVLFALTSLKVFTVDLASLDVLYRTLAFIGTGVVLFASSAWYTRAARNGA